MRNTLYRAFLEDTTASINNAIQNGIEPLALAMALRNMADQCDKLSAEFEQKEKEEEEKTDV